MAGLRRLFVISLALLLLPSPLWSQSLPADTVKRTHKDNKANLADKGFDFLIAAGLYMGGRYSAGYYSGIPENENNLDYLFDNYYWKQDIVDLIVKNNNFVSRYDSTIAVKEYPTKMRYSPSLSVSLGFTYKFSKNWGLTFIYSFSRLMAKDYFSVRYDNAIPGNERNDYLLYALVAKEDRSFFDLSVRYLFHPSKVVKPFVEIGAQFNFVKVNSFDAVIEGQEFNLLDFYGGEKYVPGMDMQTMKIIYGGPGFGFSANAGLKIVCTSVISLDPVFYVSVSRLGLKGYKDFGLNWGAYVRIIMNDSFFAK